MNKVCIVVPAYNEERVLQSVLKSIKNQGFRNIIVVDDGSTDRTYEIAKKSGVVVLRNVINRGLGCSLSIGITAALKLGADIIVTCDADGQHNPRDIKRLIAPILKKQADVVIGSRVFKREDTPIMRIVVNKISNLVTYLLFGIYCTDTQSGFRAFSREAAGKINIQTSRMEVSSEIIFEVRKNNLRLKEIPIKSIYTEYSLSKGQKVSNAFNILSKLFFKKVIK